MSSFVNQFRNIRKNIWLIDVVLLMVAVLMLVTDEIVLFFHIMFVVLTFGAFFWEFRAFVWRSTVWVIITTLFVAFAVYAGNTQPAELTEIPLLVSIMMVVFLIARQRAKVEQSLRKSEERYHTLFDNLFKDSGEAIFVTDRQGNIIQVNQAMQTMFGYDEADFLGRNFQSHFVQDEELLSFEEGLQAQNSIKNIELELHKKDGKPMTCVFSASAWRSKSNEFLGYQGIIRDVTREKQRAFEREKLLKAEHEQRLLAETLGEVFLSLTARTSHQAVLDEILRQVQQVVPCDAANIALLDGGKLMVSRMQGYEAFAKNRESLDFTKDLMDLPLDAKAITTQQAVVIPDTHRQPEWVTLSGSEWIRSSVIVPICFQQQSIGLLRLDSDTVKTFSDKDVRVLEPLARAAAIALENARLYEQAQQELAERRQAEQDLRKMAAKNQAILDILPDSLFHLTCDGKLLDYKIAAQGVIQHAMTKLWQGRHLDEMKDTELRDLLYRHIEKALSTGETQIFEYKLVHHNERDFEIWVVTSGVDEVFVIARDVTERKAREAAVQAERTRIARDLHDSLGNSLAYLSLKLQTLATEGALDDVEQVRREIVQMGAMTGHAYDVMRNILAATLPSNATDFSTALLHQVKRVGDRAGFTVEFNTRGEPRPLSALVQQQLLYLLSEALANVEKHAAAENVNIGVVWREETLTVSISDDGRGFPLDVPSLTGHFGLSIMQQRAAEINGRLNITSEPGEGTEVVVRLPLETLEPAMAA